MMNLSDISYEDLVGPEPDEEFPYGDASSLHMGACHIFAKALHDTFGYDMLRADCDSGFHVFCRAGDKYLDAAGLANSVQKLVDRLPFGGTVKTIKPVREIALDGEYADIRDAANARKSFIEEWYGDAFQMLEERKREKQPSQPGDGKTQ